MARRAPGVSPVAAIRARPPRSQLKVEKCSSWAYLSQAVMMDPRHATIAAGALDDIDLFER